MTATHRRKRPTVARKEEIIPVRVTAEEKRAFTAAAASLGLAVSAWLRMIATEALHPAGK